MTPSRTKRHAVKQQDPGERSCHPCKHHHASDVGKDSDEQPLFGGGKEQRTDSTQGQRQPKPDGRPWNIPICKLPLMILYRRIVPFLATPEMLCHQTNAEFNKIPDYFERQWDK